MIRPPNSDPWTGVIDLAVVTGVVPLASRQSPRWPRPPCHGPAVAPPRHASRDGRLS